MTSREIIRIRAPGRRGEEMAIIGAYEDKRSAAVFVCEPTEPGGRATALAFRRDRSGSETGRMYADALAAFRAASEGGPFLFGGLRMRRLTRIETEILAGELLTGMADEAEASEAQVA